MTGSGAVGRLRIVAALLLLLAAGGAAAASPGALTLRDPATWLALALAVAGLAVLSWASAALLLRRLPVGAGGKQDQVLVIPWRDQVPLVITLILASVVAFVLQHLPGQDPPAPLPSLVPVTAGADEGAPTPGTTLQPGATHSHGLGAGSYLAALLAVLLLALVLWMVIYRLRSRRVEDPPEVVPADPLAAAIEAARADLEDEPDPRRAVIKAYARTERVLQAHALPREPAEAPLEYLDRVLRQLGAQAGSVDRLTVLYERAAFSQHVVGEDMRVEALAAFTGLRDNLASVQATT